MSSFQKRVISAAVMAPVFLALVWYGGWPFIAFLCAAFAISVYEWRGLSARLPSGQILALAVGVVYMLVSFYSFYLCRELGLAHILLLLFMVWASDIGAYFFGKFIGGPKLIPAVSPNKTWAGLAGALICPWAVLMAFFAVTEGASVFTAYTVVLLLVIGVIIGLAGQAGDLLVSYMKRRVQVKDTGHLIPGHGGILDRIDSLLLVAPIFYVLIKYIVMIVAAA